MKWLRFVALVAPALVVAMLVASPSSVVQGSPEQLSARLSGFREVAPISTGGSGDFEARPDGADTIQYRLSYSGLEGTVTAAHIHFGQQGVNGGIIAYLCGGGGKPACPASGTVTGTIMAADIIGPAEQGIAAGEFDEAVRAMLAGVTYANVHSTLFPGGEIRGQIGRGRSESE